MNPGRTAFAPPWGRWEAGAVVFDLDDVLLDTRAAQVATWHWWARRVGLEPDAIADAARGRRTADVVRHLAPDRDLDAEVAAIAERDRVLLRSASRPRGARSLLRALPPGRWAVVTSATAAAARERLRRGRLPDPPVLVTADDVAAGRPDPAGHLAAAEALGVAPARCVAIESTAVGVAAGRAAGMTVLGVAAMLDGAAALEGAAAVVHEVGRLRVELTGAGVELRATREPKRYA